MGWIILAIAVTVQATRVGKGLEEYESENNNYLG